MKYNPKVVPFDRSAAYVHHRALKNMRDNNPLEALELMRHAVEHSPENREYLLDLAEMYCEMGCHEQSNRILLDMIAQKDAPAECYYGLALNQFGKNEMESARRALNLYSRCSDGGEYSEDAGGLSAEMDFYEALRKAPTRRAGRAVHVAGRACDALKADDPEKACRLFRRSFALNPRQPEMRALYAMALRLSGDGAEALREARESVSGAEDSVRALCVAAQVYRMCGCPEEARALMARAIALRPDGVELRLMVFALCELEMYPEAAEAVKLALRETPHAKALLHLRAVALHRAGAPDGQAEAFWLRILRIDPEDSVARFYQDAAHRGALGEEAPELVYEVPGAEYRRRLIEIADCLAGGLDAAVARWKSDAGFRGLLTWAVNTGDENCGCAAIMIIASAGDAASESALREFFYRSDVPVAVKLHATLYLKLRGVDLRRFMPPGMDVRDGLLPEPEELLDQMSVGDRQLVRFAGEILEAEYDLHPMSALALTWYSYRLSRSGNDPLARTQEAAAALAWNYLLQHGVKVSVRELARQFDCRERRMVYYARHMAAVLEQYGGVQTDEDR